MSSSKVVEQDPSSDIFNLKYLELFNDTLVKFIEEINETYSFMSKYVKNTNAILDKPGYIHDLISSYYKQCKKSQEQLFNSDSTILASKVSLSELNLHYLINHKSVVSSKKGLDVIWSYLHNLYTYSYLYHNNDLTGIIDNVKQMKIQQKELNNNSGDILEKIQESSSIINSMFNSKSNLNEKESNFMSSLISQITTEVGDSLKDKDLSNINTQNLLEIINSKGSVNNTGIDFQGIMEKVTKNLDSTLKNNKQDIDFSKLKETTESTFGGFLGNPKK